MPKVSVLTPIYNTNPTHLRECIESILNQSFSDFEFIILSDSPDNKELDEIVGSYEDKRIKYIKNDKNIGISASRNKLLKLACGEYLAIFDHDDVSLPTRLEQEVEILDKNPAIGVVSGFLEAFDKDKSLCIYPAPQNDNAIKVMLTYNCFVAHTAAMIRKSVLTDNHIEYESYYSPSEDYRLWARLMPHTNFFNIQQILVRYRAHDGRTSIKQCEKMYYAWESISMQIRNQFPIYYKEMTKLDDGNLTIFRVRLFGKIPLLKLKNNWIYLFEYIPLLKIKWK